MQKLQRQEQSKWCHKKQLEEHLAANQINWQQVSYIRLRVSPGWSSGVDIVLSWTSLWTRSKRSCKRATCEHDAGRLLSSFDHSSLKLFCSPRLKVFIYDTLMEKHHRSWKADTAFRPTCSLKQTEGSFQQQTVLHSFEFWSRLSFLMLLYSKLRENIWVRVLLLSAIKHSSTTSPNVLWEALLPSNTFLKLAHLLTFHLLSVL